MKLGILGDYEISLGIVTHTDERDREAELDKLAIDTTNELPEQDPLTPTDAIKIWGEVLNGS